MSTELNKQYDEAVANGYTKCRAVFIAEQKQKRSSKWSKLYSVVKIVIGVVVIGILLNVFMGSYFDLVVNKSISMGKHWLNTFTIVVGILWAGFNIFSKDES